MRKAAALLAGGAALLVALAYGFFALLRAMKDQGGFWYEAWRVLFGVPPSLERWLMAAAVVLAAATLFLAPLARAETRSERAFEREVAKVAAERPDDAMTPYAGVEGEGWSFDGPEGRILVLRAPQGVGAPIIVALPAALPLGEPALRPSPKDSYGGTPR